MNHIHSAGSNVIYGNRSVGPKERIFTKNHNRMNFSWNPQLFNGKTWGGMTLWRPTYRADLPHFCEKPIFLTLEVGRSWGGDGGATFSIHGGRWWGVCHTHKRFSSQKSVFFWTGCSFEYSIEAPPLPPPHDMECRIWRCDIWTLTWIKNYVFSIIIHVFRVTKAAVSDF